MSRIIWGEPNDPSRFRADVDFIPDPSDDRFFYCLDCGFFIGKDRDKGEWDQHLRETGHMATRDVPVHEIAGPMTPDVIPVKSPRTMVCKTCGAKIVGFKQFMDHKKQHKRDGAQITASEVPEPQTPGLIERAKKMIGGAFNG